MRLQYELARRALAESDAKENADFHRSRARHLGVSPEETVVFGDLLPPQEPMRSRLALRRGPPPALVGRRPAPLPPPARAVVLLR